jgi:hypothetical protein
MKFDSNKDGNLSWHETYNIVKASDKKTELNLIGEETPAEAEVEAPTRTTSSPRLRSSRLLLRPARRSTTVSSTEPGHTLTRTRMAMSAIKSSTTSLMPSMERT